MSAFRRFIPTVLAFIAQVALQVSGYQSPVLATLLLILMVTLAVMGGWPWLKRWRPFTFAPVGGKGYEDAQGPSDLDKSISDLVETVAEYASLVSAQLVEGDFEGFKRSVFALGLEVLRERSFQIGRASMDKDRLVIVVEDAEGTLRLGDKLIVVDTEDFYFMGTFEVVRKRAEGCHAVERKDADGLWKGAVRSGKKGDEVTYKTAILKERRAEQWQATT